MLKHADIWAALDAIAHDHGLTASALARKAGLDPTTFNKSKRITRDGKPRWPSTESIGKVLDATGLSLAAFVGYVDGHPAGGPRRHLPLAITSQPGLGALFDAHGHPQGDGWDNLAFAAVDDPHAYALEIQGDGLRPLYRDGDVLVVSPAAPVRRGDRVVVGTHGGDVLIRGLVRHGANRLDLAGPDGVPPGESLDNAQVAWLARILWASQ